MTSTYCDENGENTYHPLVKGFFANPLCLNNCLCTVVGGNKAFGPMFAYAAKALKRDYDLKCIYAYELRGSERDTVRLLHRLSEIKVSASVK